MGEKYYLAIDLGGTNIKSGVIREDGVILRRASRPTGAAGGVETVKANLRAALRELLENGPVPAEAIAGIGMGIPGLLDPQRGVSYLSPNLPGWKDISVREIFEREFGLPVEIDNDVRSHAHGEKLFGAGRGVDNFLLITLGTGIGSGIFLGGELFRGAGGVGGEVGHITVLPDGPRCGCGNYGCVEALAGAPGIVRRARQALAGGVKSKLVEMVEGDLEKLTPAVIFAAAQAGDEVARKVADDTGRYIGIAMASVVNVLNPQRLIIGGGVAKAGEMLIGRIREEIRRRAMPPHVKLLEVVPAELGEDAGLIGAAMWVPTRRGAAA